MTLKIYKHLDQGSDAWHDARRGIVTASVVGKLLTVGPPDAISVDCPTCSAKAGNPCLSLSTKKAPTEIKTIHEARAAQVADLPPVVRVADNDTSRLLTATLATERIAGFTESTPMTFDMYRGVDTEPIARDAYAERHKSVREIGFMRLDEAWGTLGYSPDGLVGDDGLIEIKAPRAKTHVLTILADKVPGYYMGQLQAGLLVSGRKWIDFVSYCGGLPLWVKRVHPDPDWHAAITAAVLQFETTAAEMTAAYNIATSGLAATKRIDFNNVELKLA